MKARETEQSLMAKMTKRFNAAMDKLRSLGMRIVTTRSGRKFMYVPGDVNLRNPMNVEDYGSHVALYKRTHKLFLRKHKLGKFKKSK